MICANANRVWSTLGGFTYDEVGRVKTVTDATGLTVGYDYNNLDNITKVSYPDGTAETTEYTCCGIPGVVTDRAGRKSYYDYDVMKRLTRVQDAQGNTLQMDRDANGNLRRLVDAKGHLTKWNYDAVDRVIAKMYGDGTTEAYAYDRGLLSQSKGARNQIVKYSYDANSNLTLIDYPNMSDVSMSYDNLDDVTQIVDGVGTNSFTYDNRGKLLSLDGPFANDGQSFTYDALQRLQSQSVERGASGGTQSQSYAYDALGRLATLTSNGTQGVGSFNYSYFGPTRMLQSLQMPNGAQVTRSYDGLHRLTQISNLSPSSSVQSRYAYSYDNRQIRTAMQVERAGEPLQQVNYTYDTVNELVGEAATGGVAGGNYTNAFTYDAMGNRLKTDSVAGSDTSNVKSSVNALNQLTSVSSTVNGSAPTTSGLSYDVAGNLTDATNADGSKTIYSYDDADRLYRIERRDAQNVPLSKTEFVYDYAWRNSISREFAWTNGAWQQSDEKRRVFSGMNVVQERNATNQVTAQLVRRGNIGGILARSTATGTMFYGYDGAGNVTTLTDGAGAVVGSYAYDAFGNTVTTSGVAASENPYRFSTKEQIGGLYSYGYRFYAPGLGRWINRDPIHESGGTNIYAFVSNNPVNRLDWRGLQTEADDKQKEYEEGFERENQAAQQREAEAEGQIPFSEQAQEPVEEPIGELGSGSPGFNLTEFEEEVKEQSEESRAVAGGGADLDYVSESQRRRMQSFADCHDLEVTLVGSRAGGKSGANSDYDYLIGGNTKDRYNARKELPRGSSGGEVNAYGGYTGIDVFNKNKVPLDPTRPHIIFPPRGRG